jgi:opacity protein-like surface antigen
VADNFQLSSFRGALLSVKHQVSPRSAWRLGAEVDFSDQNQSTRADTLLNESDATLTSLGVTFEYLRYTSPVSRTKVYFGGGLGAGYGRASTGRLFPTTHSNTTWSWSGSLNGLLGVEWFMTGNLSLSGEYGLSIRYRKEKNTQENDSAIQTGERSTFSISDRGVLFGLSAYF